MEKLTIELLKELGACEDGINLVKNNGLDGFPLDRINEVKGDFKGFVSWLRPSLKNRPIVEYDSNGNKTKEIYPSGNIYQYEYDPNGNKTKKIYPNGDIIQWEYDSNGNMTKKINPNGDVIQYEYDSNGNMTKKINPNGDVIQYEYTHYENGQLKSISENGVVVLEIPEFEQDTTYDAPKGLDDVEIALDLHEDTLELLKQAAEITGKSVEDFILDAAISKAVRTR